MSPRRTLRIWGSSSRLVLRRNRPTRVMRGSFGILKSGGGRMLRWASDAFSSSALATMVRNLNIGKRRPNWPVRDCRIRTGPGLSSRIAGGAMSAPAHQDGAGTVEPDRDGADERHRDHDREDDQADRDIEQPLERPLPRHARRAS